MIKSLARSKKGMFFTIIAIIISILFISSVIVHERFAQIEKMEQIELRAETIDDFLSAIERDFERALYISGYRALLSIDSYIIDSGIFVDDAEQSFLSLITNATLQGSSYPIMQNQTLEDWTLKVEVIAQQFDIDADIDVLSVSLSQDDPWYLTVESQINISLSDERGVASWKRTWDAKNSIPIDGFNDPLYVVKTNGVVLRKITPTNITQWDADSLRSFLASSQYRANTDAPSFLMRLEGSLSSSPYGIECVVGKNELISLEVISPAQYGLTNIDHLFWINSQVNASSVRGVTDTGYTYFKLDDYHADYYGVEDDLY